MKAITPQTILDRVVICGITEAFNRIDGGEKIGAVLSAVPEVMIEEAPDGRKLLSSIARKNISHYASYMFNIYPKMPELFRAPEPQKLPYYEAEIAETLDTGVKMFRTLSKGERIILHCLNAKSRSPTLAVALFMKLLGGNKHMDTALELLDKLCPNGTPNRFTEDFRKHFGSDFDTILSAAKAYSLERPLVANS